MRFYPNRLKVIFAGVALAGTLGFGCSDTGEDEESDESSGTSTAGTVYAPGSTEKAVGSSIEGGALNLSAMPNLADALSTGSTSLALSATGTPPNFIEINKDNLTTYFSGDVSALITNIESAVTSSDWDSVKTYLDTFRQAQAKCRIMEHAARQIEDLSRLTTSACYMKEIDKPEASMLTYVEGNADIPAGGFFAVPDGTPESAPVIREIDFSGGPALALQKGPGGGGKDGGGAPPAEADGQESDNKGPETIRFKISNDANIYRIQLVFCQEGVATGSDIIQVNSNEGSELMTFSNFHGGEEVREGVTETFAFAAVMNAGVTSSTDENGDPVLEFDPAKPKTLDIMGHFSSDSFTQDMHGQMTITEGILDTRFVGKGTNTMNSQTFENSIQGFSTVLFSGEGAENVKIYEGGGRSVGSFKDPSQTSAQTFDQTVGFEYNESASPRYQTVSSSDYLTTVAGVDFANDAVLKDSAPEAPEKGALFSDADCGGTVADGTVDAVYKFMPTEAAFGAVESECENRFDGGSEICRALSDIEQRVFSAVRSKEAAGH